MPDVKLDADGKLVPLDFMGMRCVHCGRTRRSHMLELRLPDRIACDFEPRDMPRRPDEGVVES